MGRPGRPRLAAVLLWSGVTVAGAGLAVFLWSEGLERAGWWAAVGALVVAVVTLLCQFPVFRGSRREARDSVTGGSVTDIHDNEMVVNDVRYSSLSIDLGDHGRRRRSGRKHLGRS